MDTDWQTDRQGDGMLACLPVHLETATHTRCIASDVPCDAIILN